MDLHARRLASARLDVIRRQCAIEAFRTGTGEPGGGHDGRLSCGVAGLRHFRRAAATPFDLILETRR